VVKILFWGGVDGTGGGGGRKRGPFLQSLL
jgi:hypothetical protein